MAGAAVTQEAVDKAVNLCNRSIQSLGSASEKLKQKYEMAGSQWKDSKYQQLGQIISECRAALGKPVDQLNACITTLGKLRNEIINYESTNV
jgi:hypothetical protein